MSGKHNTPQPERQGRLSAARAFMGKFDRFTQITTTILLIGVAITIVRFTAGLGPVTNLSQDNPWGIWISFDLLCGVALAAGGYVTSAACYLFGYKKFHSAVRPAILTAFLGYALVVFALHYDVGRPWRLPFPIFVSQGTTSLLFEVGLCVFLYLTVLFLEFVPAALEWLGLKNIRQWAVRLTLVLTIFGVVLSTLHQSSLGALFVIAPSKVHPLWYSSYLPVYFFISSIVAGLSMVIFEGTLSHKYFHNKMDQEHLREHDNVILGFARAAAFVLAGYFCIKVIGLAKDNNWEYLATGYGAWYLVEMLGFVALPAFMYAIGVRENNYKLIQWTSVLAVLGLIINRFNVSMIAFNWNLPAERQYFPSIWELLISIFIVTIGILVFRFIATRMPIFYTHPEYPEH
ncbi:MAG: sulfate respiration complex protein HmcC [Thermodesulfobacteriota bacterium]